MGRPHGKRNPDYENKRANLVAGLVDYVLAADLVRPSFRQMAAAGSVSEPTLRHYFGERGQVTTSILSELGKRAKPFIDRAAIPFANGESTIRDYIDLCRAGVAHGGFGRAHAFGLIEGLADAQAGEHYLTQLLEPSLAAIEHKVTPFLPNDANPNHKRAMALMIFAPILLLILHQTLLSGDKSAPLDIDGVLDELIGACTRSLA